MDKKKLKEAIERYKYPIIVIVVGIGLLLLPAKNNDDSDDAKSYEQRLEQILEESRGAGNVSAVISEHGAVIVCDGADNYEVKLNIINAVKAYTGLKSDDIQVLSAKTQN